VKDKVVGADSPLVGIIMGSDSDLPKMKVSKNFFSVPHSIISLLPKF
jgi:phosphoribosylcarboxyaminoimidazole (NCAIR) mutase